MDIIVDAERPVGVGLETYISMDASLVGRDAAVAAIALSDGTVVTGEAKRCPGDPFDWKVANCLAVGRALEAAGLYLQEVALEASGGAAHREGETCSTC